MTENDVGVETETGRFEERARAGDVAAKAELLGRSRESLVRFSYRYLSDVHLAEDVAQDVLATVSAEGQWPQGNLRSWLLRLARNRCLDVLKSRKDGRVGAGSFLSDPSQISPRTGPRTAFARQERAELLRKQLAGLREPLAEVLMLRYFEDLSHKDIAEVLDLPESTVQSRLLAGRRELQRKMNEEKP